MKINSTNNINFNGTYRVNINHSMPNKFSATMRDGLVAFWSRQAINREEVREQLYHYFHSVRKVSQDNQPYYITVKIVDDCNYNFEDSMKSCAQTFEKLA